MGGTNAHAVIEEAPELPASSPSRASQLIVLSARTRAALDVATAQLTDYFVQDPDASLADVAYTLQVGRRGFAHRRILIGSDAGTAVSGLSQPDRAPVFTGVAETADRSCVFLFSGQGSQYAGMARELYRDEPSFRADVDDCCVALLPYLGRDLRELLNAEGSRGGAAARRTPSGAVRGRACAGAVVDAGGNPACGDAGHSVGEYVAACLPACSRQPTR
jgi:acyl transferase domain-containing protein